MLDSSGLSTSSDSLCACKTQSSIIIVVVVFRTEDEIPLYPYHFVRGGSILCNLISLVDRSNACAKTVMLHDVTTSSGKEFQGLTTPTAELFFAIAVKMFYITGILWQCLQHQSAQKSTSGRGVPPQHKLLHDNHITVTSQT